ncbi:hypothetical protein A5707_04035 [Mycobacterium kyorinense]|uniref:ATPase n=1 Tax=Mycobacterium kyorinense TaxID=487514 RepID=A0A1A2Z3R4_9MYCO|nr:hypothetical protein A5707_04035 [Mycobacterium kyorinense]
MLGERRRHVCCALPAANHRGVRSTRPRGEGGRRPMNLTNATGLVLAVLVAAFLVAALLFPEQF